LTGSQGFSAAGAAGCFPAGLAVAAGAAGGEAGSAFPVALADALAGASAGAASPAGLGWSARAAVVARVAATRAARSILMGDISPT
jgi:hypothetical protein